MFIIIIIIVNIMKNERRKTPTNLMCLQIFGFNNLIQALFNWHSLSFNGGLIVIIIIMYATRKQHKATAVLTS